MDSIHRRLYTETNERLVKMYSDIPKSRSIPRKHSGKAKKTAEISAYVGVDGESGVPPYEHQDKQIIKDSPIMNDMKSFVYS